MGRLIGASTYPVRHHFGELNTTRLAFISIYPAEGPFQSHEEPTFKTVIPYMRGHSCACPSTKWTGMCRLSRPWRTGLWAHSPSPPLSRPSPPRTPWPEPTPPSWAVTRCAAGLYRMNRHSHIASGSVCSSAYVCMFVRGRGKLREGEAERGRRVVLDVNSCSQ